MEPGIAVTALDHEHPERFLSLRRALGITSFGINQMLLRPGERGRIHAHERQEEVYLVLRGVLTLVLQGEERDIPEGGLVRVAPDVRRQLVNRGPAVCSLVALGGAGVHEGRDGLSYTDWDDRAPRPPQEIPLPADLPPAELRTG